ncbi:MFS family permease [Brevibacillus nitrificans]|nr:MFS family permease [Brevibacillus nitrificans]
MSERYGRTLIPVPGLLLTVLCVFGMAFVHSFGSLLFMRLLLNFIEGGFIGATAGLVRDFSPRMGRALSFGFWSYGTSGSNFFAALIAGYTLPYFGTCLIVAVFVLFTIHDLSPRLREKVIESNATAVQENEEGVPRERASASSTEGSTERSDAMTPVQNLRLAMKQKHIWALAIGCTFFLMLYLTLASYGPLILVQAFGYTPARAAFVSLGGSLGFAYSPWMALYSENLEDIHGGIQASGWAVWSFVLRVYAILYFPLLCMGKGPWFKRPFSMSVPTAIDSKTGKEQPVL